MTSSAAAPVERQRVAYTCTHCRRPFTRRVRSDSRRPVTCPHCAWPNPGPALVDDLMAREELRREKLAERRDRRAQRKAATELDLADAPAPSTNGNGNGHHPPEPAASTPAPRAPRPRAPRTPAPPGAPASDTPPAPPRPPSSPAPRPRRGVLGRLLSGEWEAAE